MGYRSVARSLFLVIIAGFASCAPLLPFEDTDVANDVLKRLNGNVEGMRSLIRAIESDDCINFFSLENEEDSSFVYCFETSLGNSIFLYSELPSDNRAIPVLSFAKYEDSYYWIIDGEWLADKSGSKVAVMDSKKVPYFTLEDNKWYCSVNKYTYKASINSHNDRVVWLEFNPVESVFSFNLCSGETLSLSTTDGFSLARTDVKNEVFYKDIFLDAGIGLTSRKSLYAVTYLGLSLEGICFSRSDAKEDEFRVQNEILSGCDYDTNGRLLYPDGQPRFKVLFVNGGSSTAHGKSIDSIGLRNMRQFVINGGSYVGTCAGAFFASKGYDSYSDYPYYLSIWPGVMSHTGISNDSTGMFIVDNSPLLCYFDFGGDRYVSDVFHNMGGFPNELPEGTEILARYDYPEKKAVHFKPSIWAYKRDLFSGRVVQEGSHPEGASSGEKRDLTAAMILYAIEGGGVVSVKGVLSNGIRWESKKHSEDNDPDHTCIGDLQCHHYLVYIPYRAKNIRFRVESSSNEKLCLRANYTTFAFPDASEYVSSVGSGELSFTSLKEGLWYLSVQCMETVDVEQTDYGQAYNDPLSVLNGVPYSISVSWD